MVTKKAQLEFIGKETGAVMDILRSINIEKPGKDDVHDMRVHIKKIFAMMELSRAKGAFTDSLHLLHIRNLFKTLGKIRSSQLILASMKKSGIDSRKIRHFHDAIIDHATAALLSNLNDHIGHMAGFNTYAGKTVQPLANRDLSVYLGRKKNYLRKLFSLPLDANIVHEGRKQIKHLLYVMETPGFPAGEIRKDEFNNLQEVIGKWHDLATQIDFIREFRPGGNSRILSVMTGKERKQFEKISGLIRDYPGIFR